MAYAPHALVAIVGKWGGSDMANEVWQVGVRISTGGPAGGILAGPQAYCDVVAPLIATWFNGSPLFPNNATLTMVKVNNINAAGHYVDPVTHQTVVTASGGNPVTVPAFVTAAATFETGRTTGRARRGRIYLPSAIALDTSKGVTFLPANAILLRDKVKALLTILLRNEPTGGLLTTPSIVSKIAADVNPINGVSVNNVWDVQRRRKNRALGVRSAIAAFP